MFWSRNKKINYLLPNMLPTALRGPVKNELMILPSPESFKKDCCQLQAKVNVHEVHVLVNCLFKLAQEKVWLGELTVPP